MNHIKENEFKEAITRKIKFKITTGETLSINKYLDAAIDAFNLKPCDYYTAYYILRKVSEGKSPEEIRKEIYEFWVSMGEKYGK